MLKRLNIASYLMKEVECVWGLEKQKERRGKNGKKQNTSASFFFRLEEEESERKCTDV